MNASSQPETAIEIRAPRMEDAAGIHRLVEESGVLDVNSPYAYLLVCTDFADTSVVADRDGEVVGFVAAYRPPPQPDTVFVWQIGVAESARRQGLGRRMLAATVRREGCDDVRYLDTTITPSNAASRHLFESFASAENAEIHRSEAYFPASAFGEGSHEAEDRYRIGPLEKRKHGHL